LSDCRKVALSSTINVFGMLIYPEQRSRQC
jgi:hypothetical protein